MTTSLPKSGTLVLTDVHKTYPDGFEALKGVSLRVEPSEVVAIIGPSGCGKSTLLRTINGLESIEQGTITYGGQTLGAGNSAASTAQWRAQIGMVFQSYELFPHLTVIENLLLAPRVVKKLKRDELRERAQQLLTRVGLAQKAHAYPRELSGGQKQRVAIVRALMMDPQVLLLDEVTASLDPEMVREVLDVIAELAADGMTMLLVTHEMAFARAVADRVVFMDAGVIVESGEPEEFFTQPQTSRAQKFLNTFTFEHRE